LDGGFRCTDRTAEYSHFVLSPTDLNTNLLEPFLD
jgi:hypothetical protein